MNIRDSCHEWTWQMSRANVTNVTSQRDKCHGRTWQVSRTNVTAVTQGDERHKCTWWTSRTNVTNVTKERNDRHEQTRRPSRTNATTVTRHRSIINRVKERWNEITTNKKTGSYYLPGSQSSFSYFAHIHSLHSCLFLRYGVPGQTLPLVFNAPLRGIKKKNE